MPRLNYWEKKKLLIKCNKDDAILMRSKILPVSDKMLQLSYFCSYYQNLREWELLILQFSCFHSVRRQHLSNSKKLTSLVFSLRCVSVATVNQLGGSLFFLQRFTCDKDVARETLKYFLRRNFSQIFLTTGNKMRSFENKLEWVENRS